MYSFPTLIVDNFVKGIYMLFSYAHGVKFVGMLDGGNHTPPSARALHCVPRRAEPDACLFFGLSQVRARCLLPRPAHLYM